MPTFKERHDLETRRDICRKALKKHSDHVPAILEPMGTSAPDMGRQRYLLPLELTGGQLQYVVRHRLKMQKEDALFLFCGDRTLVPSQKTARELTARYRDEEDGLLYIYYALENTFG